MQVRPAGETVEARATVPVNPFMGAIVIAEVAAVPTFTLTLVELAVMEKSGTGTVTVIVASLVNLPETHVMFTEYVPGAILPLADIVS